MFEIVLSWSHYDIELYPNLLITYMLRKISKTRSHNVSVGKLVVPVFLKKVRNSRKLFVV